MEEYLAYLFELRLKARGDARRLAVVDRAIAVLAELEGADAARMAELEAEVRRIADELALMFGSPKDAVLQ